MNLPRLALSAFALATLCLTGTAPGNAATASAESQVVYGQGGDHDLHARIAYPTDLAGPLPAIIYIHGGGWIAGNNGEGSMQDIAQHGYFAASIEYRLSNVAKWPAQIQDCKLAVRWLRANAAKYHVDPNRIGVWGSSAGGHLVDCLGTMAGVKAYDTGAYPGVSSSVQAVVDFFGPTDFTGATPIPANVINLLNGLFGVPRDQNPALWKSGSPLAYVKAGDPPFLIAQGDSDQIVPMVQSTKFSDALAKAGVPHQLIIVKNADHGFGPVKGKTPPDPDMNVINQAVFAFFDKYLKTP